jgi:hypothetical protein
MLNSRCAFQFFGCQRRVQFFVGRAQCTNVLQHVLAFRLVLGNQPLPGREMVTKRVVRKRKRNGQEESCQEEEESCQEEEESCQEESCLEDQETNCQETNC